METSRIKKAQQLINGKSKFMTKKGLEQKKKEYYISVVKKLPDIIAKSNKKKIKYDHDHFSIYYNGKYNLKILISTSVDSGLVTAITVYHIQYKDKRAKPVLELKGNQITELRIKTKIEKVIKPEIKRISKEMRRKNKSGSDVFFKEFEESLKTRGDRKTRHGNITDFARLLQQHTIEERKRRERRGIKAYYPYVHKKDVDDNWDL